MRDPIPTPSKARSRLAHAVRFKNAESERVARQQLNAAHLLVCIEKHGADLAKADRQELVHLLRKGGE